MLNIHCPKSKTGVDWPSCHFFGIFDGHGGQACADYLRDNLYDYIIQTPDFPSNIEQAIQIGFDRCEKAIKGLFAKRNKLNKSGSCAVVAFVVNNEVYVANLGDS